MSVNVVCYCSQLYFLPLSSYIGALLFLTPYTVLFHCLQVNLNGSFHPSHKLTVGQKSLFRAMPEALSNFRGH